MELQVLGEDAGDVRVPLEAVALDQGEDALHLALVVDVFGEDVLVERVAGRAVDEEEAVFAVAPRPLGEELPALLADRPRLGGGFSSWARVQKMARSADGLKPSGSNIAPWS